MGNNKLPPYTYLGCAVTKDRTPWCRSVCKPKNGLGQCGRPFPGGLESGTQRAIKKHKARRGNDNQKKPAICPRCSHSLITRTKDVYIISECLSCGYVIRNEISHD